MCSVGTTLLPDRCPQRLGVAWSSRRTAATPGLLVIARADDVDGVPVTGVKDRAGSSITQDDMPKCSQLLAPSHGENRGSSPLGSAIKSMTWRLKFRSVQLVSCSEHQPR